MPTFLEAITPLLMHRRLEELCAQRPDIQTLLYILNQEQKLLWLHSIGVCQDAVLESLVPPFPPLEIRSIVAAPELEIFLWTGLVDISNFLSLYQQYKYSSDPSCPVILDFGCGCGRLTRFLNNKEQYTTYACDVNPDSVHWCQDNLKDVTTLLNSSRPPLPFADTSFNFIYSLSIFTHLPEYLVTLWLDEFARLIAPHGLLVLTVHGYTALNIIKNSEIHQSMFQIDVEYTQEIINNFQDTLFVFLDCSEGVLTAAKIPNDYGNSFIHPDYINKNWNSHYWSVLEFIPGGLRGWQDIVILQRTANLK